MLALKQEQLFDKVLTSITPINSIINVLWIKEVTQRKTDIKTSNVPLVNGNEVFKKTSLQLDSYMTYSFHADAEIELNASVNYYEECTTHRDMLRSIQVY